MEHKAKVAAAQKASGQEADAEENEDNDLFAGGDDN